MRSGERRNSLLTGGNTCVVDACSGKENREMAVTKLVGSSVKRIEDPRLLCGKVT